MKLLSACCQQFYIYKSVKFGLNNAHCNSVNSEKRTKKKNVIGHMVMFLFRMEYTFSTSLILHQNVFSPKIQFSPFLPAVKCEKSNQRESLVLPQEVLIASRSSAYFHLLRSYFFTPIAALLACTCGPLGTQNQILFQGKIGK